MISPVYLNSSSIFKLQPPNKLTGEPIVMQSNSSSVASQNANYLGITSQELLNKLYNLRAKILQEIKTAQEATLAEGLTCPVALLEVLWGVAELCGTGLFSKLIYAVTSGEELLAAGWVAKSLGDYAGNLGDKLFQLDSVIASVQEGLPLDGSSEQTVILEAALNDNLRPLFHSPHNDAANKLVSILQGSIGLLLGALSILKISNKDPGIFKKIEHHPIPRAINSFKGRLFSIFPGKFKEVAEITLLAAPMVALGIWKKGLSDQSMSHTLASTLNGQSIANWTCAAEAFGNGAQLLFNEDATLASIMNRGSQNGLMIRPIRNLLEIPLCLWMAWNYLGSAADMLASSQKGNK